MTVSTPLRPSKAVSARLKRMVDQDQAYLVLGLIAVLCVVFTVSVHGFASVKNLVNIIEAVAGLGILALAQAVVVVGRGLDLSVVAIYGVTAQLIANEMNAGRGQVAALLIGLGTAVILGFINGILIAYVDVPALFVTLATSLLYLGFFRLAVFNNGVIFTFPSSARIVEAIGHGTWLGIPISAFVWLMAATICWLLLNRTAPGRMVYARGDNPAAASLTGIPVRPLTMLTYVASAVLAMLAGLQLTGSSGTFDGRVLTSGSQLYDVLAVVVIGGVSLAGGRGTVIGVIMATLLIGVILNGMTLLDFTDTQQSVCRALIVLAALVLDRYLHPPNEETARPGEL